MAGRGSDWTSIAPLSLQMIKRQTNTIIIVKTTPKLDFVINPFTEKANKSRWLEN